METREQAPHLKKCRAMHTASDSSTFDEDPSEIIEQRRIFPVVGLTSVAARNSVQYRDVGLVWEIRFNSSRKSTPDWLIFQRTCVINMAVFVYIHAFKNLF